MYYLGTFVGGLLAGGIGGSLLTLRFGRSNRVIGSGTAIDQGGSSARGDIVGRDKTTH